MNAWHYLLENSRPSTQPLPGLTTGRSSWQVLMFERCCRSLPVRPSLNRCTTPVLFKYATGYKGSGLLANNRLTRVDLADWELDDHAEC